MSILDFIEWCQGPGVYDWAMKSCHEACSKVFEEQKTENKYYNFQDECKLVKAYKKGLEKSKHRRTDSRSITANIHK